MTSNPDSHHANEQRPSQVMPMPATVHRVNLTPLERNPGGHYHRPHVTSEAPDITLPSISLQFPSVPRPAIFDLPPHQFGPTGPSNEYVERSNSDTSTSVDRATTPEPLRRGDDHAHKVYRERRAQRVLTLEERLRQAKEAHEKSEAVQLERIDELRRELMSYKTKSEVLEGLLERERKERLEVEKRMGRLRWNQHSSPHRRSISPASSQPGVKSLTGSARSTERSRSPSKEND